MTKEETKQVMDAEELAVPERDELLKGYELNLSDFALFLSVMKEKKAYQNVMSIILKEQDLELEEVKVEQVILNKKGKDRAMYTFKEMCIEEQGLELGDETTKIFLNMTSKNGDPELVSLLQYMKKTDLGNPDIIKKDERILELDHIVQEVKSSEEWEAVQMNILEIGIQAGEERGEKRGEKRGIELGEKRGIQALVETCKELGESIDSTVERIVKKYSISKEKASEYVAKYWK